MNNSKNSELSVLVLAGLLWLSLPAQAEKNTGDESSCSQVAASGLQTQAFLPSSELALVVAPPEHLPLSFTSADIARLVVGEQAGILQVLSPDFANVSQYVRASDRIENAFYTPEQIASLQEAFKLQDNELDSAARLTMIDYEQLPRRKALAFLGFLTAAPAISPETAKLVRYFLRDLVSRESETSLRRQALLSLALGSHTDAATAEFVMQTLENEPDLSVTFPVQIYFTNHSRFVAHLNQYEAFLARAGAVDSLYSQNVVIALEKGRHSAQPETLGQLEQQNSAQTPIEFVPPTQVRIVTTDIPTVPEEKTEPSQSELEKAAAEQAAAEKAAAEQAAAEKAAAEQAAAEQAAAEQAAAEQAAAEQAAAEQAAAEQAAAEQAAAEKAAAEQAAAEQSRIVKAQPAAERKQGGTSPAVLATPANEKTKRAVSPSNVRLSGETVIDILIEDSKIKR